MTDDTTGSSEVEPPSEGSSPRRWSLLPAVAALLVAAMVCAVVLARVSASPMQPYGSDSAEYIEHHARMTTLLAWAEFQRYDDFEAFLHSIDGSFPPVLHLVTLVLGSLSGHAEQEVIWTGLVWLGLLAVSVGASGWLLSGSMAVGLAAFVGTFLMPSGHAVATRYYYDLPMTALLWSAVPVGLALWSRRPVLGGLMVGLLWFMAALVKWSALPFGGVMVLGIMLSGRLQQNGSPWRTAARLLVATILSVLVVGLLSTAFIREVGPHDSFTAMLGDIGERGEVWGPQGFHEGGVEGVVQHLLGTLRPLTEDRLAFYPQRLVASLFSPVLLAPVLLLMCWWIWKKPRGWALVLMVVVGQWLFLLLRVRPVDDRFLLTLAPALVLAAALGWGELPRRIARAVGWLLVLVGLVVCVDFHHSFGQPPPSGGVPGSDRQQRWGLSDSMDQRGWARRDAQVEDRTELREKLWRRLEACEGEHLRFAFHEPFVGDQGDQYWFEYRVLYAHLEEGQPRRRLLPLCTEAPPHETQLALVSVRSGETPVLPACLAGQGWQLDAVIPVGLRDRDLAVWSPPGPWACPGHEEPKAPRGPP
ncbi:MAG TPA: hypothetical protein DIU15_15845 [Deltaproteobacteria bacterium]|nr:hypothetical protein [Deltaproteobacteria bacterium]HCP47514.1 hypothetical protein [Deltaproteobacteria bacterium]